jgi:hypothetical protein
LEIFESHSGGQRFERHINIGPLMKSAGLDERAVDPHDRARDIVDIVSEFTHESEYDAAINVLAEML